MTIIEAIDKINELKPNDYAQNDKIAWLSTCDGIIQRNIVDKHSVREYAPYDMPVPPPQKDDMSWTLDLGKPPMPIPAENRPEFKGYDEHTDLNTKLLAYPPYDELYITWLESKIDYYNGEYTKYNNAVLAFNDQMQAFENDYNRRHIPLGRRIRYY